MNRATLVLFIIVLLAIGGGVVWYLVSSSQSGKPPVAAVATTTDTMVSGDAIYTNGPYGFAIQYPEAATVQNAFSSYYHLAPTWRANALPNATGTPIVSLATYSTKSENSYPRYYDALIRISASSDPKEIATCLKATPDQGEVEEPVTVFGGATWKTFSFQNAGMQQYVKGVSYRTMHDNKCFVIEKIAVGSSYRDDPASSTDVPDSVLEKAYQDLDRVVRTFTFVR